MKISSDSDPAPTLLAAGRATLTIPAHITRHRRPQARQLAFKAIARSALESSRILVPRWLPDGRRVASEWIAHNPTRDDHKLGSFKINLKSGRWSDFATGDAGGDLISLRAYLDDVRQGEAARRIAEELGLS